MVLDCFMKKVITYGTFDLFHDGHSKLLARARDLGDYLIVGVTSESYDANRGKLNVSQSLMERINNVRLSGFADEIIIEEFEGQKIVDIQRMGVSIFAIGSDWLGKFDYLKDYCEVVYLERTKGVSSTILRNKTNRILSVGIAGAGRIAYRFFQEAKFVSGVEVVGVFGRTRDKLQQFVSDCELAFFETDYQLFLKKVDAVYIATPHLTHYQFAKAALLAGKHVLCEKPSVLRVELFDELSALAASKGLVFMEAIKTAYCPAFIRLVSAAKSGVIGEIKSVKATFTKLMEGNAGSREFNKEEAGGSFTELASYPLLAAVKLLGTEVEDASFFSWWDEDLDVDQYTSFLLKYKGAVFSGEVGLGVKSEGEMIISGTRGYIFVPAPWWKTERYELRFENSNHNRMSFHKFEGDGLRYELAGFLRVIKDKQSRSYELAGKESRFIAGVMEMFLAGKGVTRF